MPREKKRKQAEMEAGEENGGQSHPAEVDSGALQRKIDRRDKKVERLTVKLSGRDKQIKDLEEEHQKLKDGLAAKQGTVDDLQRSLDDLKEKCHCSDSRLHGWAKRHKSSQGKLIEVDEATRIGNLMRDENECLEIQKGEFVRFLPGARCYGFWTEAGTNIVLPAATQLPEPIKAAVEAKVAEHLKVEIRKNPQMSGVDQKASAFNEYSTALQYCFTGDHQGPVYVLNRKPVMKPEWAKDALYTMECLIAEQPSMLQEILRFSIEKSGLNDVPVGVRKEAMVRVLKTIKANHRKQALTVFGSSKGRAPRKMTIPETMDPGKGVVKKNNKLPKLPPLYDGRKVPVENCPQIGMPETQVPTNKRKRKPRKKKPQPEDKSDSSGHNDEQRKQEDAKVEDKQGAVEDDKKEAAELGGKEQEQKGFRDLCFVDKTPSPNCSPHEGGENSSEEGEVQATFDREKMKLALIASLKE